MRLFTLATTAQLISGTIYEDYGPAVMVDDSHYGEEGDIYDDYHEENYDYNPFGSPIEIGARGLSVGGPTGWKGMTARQLETVEELNADKGPKSGPSTRSSKFKESGGYIVIEKQGNCWEKCGRRKGWSGFCSYCSLSNGSPGFCCNPRSQGGCSAGMVKAVRASTLRIGSILNC